MGSPFFMLLIQEEPGIHLRTTRVRLEVHKCDEVTIMKILLLFRTTKALINQDVK